MAKYHANFLSNPAIGTIVDNPISIMKNLIYSLSLFLLISIISCKSKKYTGCCTYDITYKNGNPTQHINDCFVEADEAQANGKKSAYEQARHNALESSGQPYQTDVTGVGCNY